VLSQRRRYYLAEKFLLTLESLPSACQLNPDPVFPIFQSPVVRPFCGFADDLLFLDSKEGVGQLQCYVHILGIKPLSALECRTLPGYPSNDEYMR
jgi:hypothetical protein